MQSLKISLPDETRAALDAASAQSGKSLADEIRNRLAWSFARDAGDKPTRDLQSAVDRLTNLIRLQFGHAWHSSADAYAAFTFGIMGAIGRHKPADDAAPKSDRPVPLIASDEPATIGIGLEALAFHTAAADDPALQAEWERTSEIRRKFTVAADNPALEAERKKEEAELKKKLGRIFRKGDKS
jgi:hypothetical protein